MRFLLLIRYATLLHFAHKPCLCYAPFALHSCRRDAHDFPRLAYRAPDKIPQFDNPRSLRI